MSTAAEFISASVSKEQGLSFKSGKLFARRTIPGSAGLQTKELSWGIKDYDGSHFSLRPDDFPQAQRLLARGKAVRDLQALLTSSAGAGAQATDILRAFNLVYWLVPTVERQTNDKNADISGVGHLICHKTSGHPLEGFSGCSANAVWAGLPSPLHQAIVCWLKGHYYRVKSGRSNEYQLAAKEDEDPAFKQQQMAAFTCLPQLELIIALLDSYSQRSVVDPTGLGHLKLADSLTDAQLKRGEQFILNPEVSPVQLPVSQQKACTDLHVIRCHLHGPGVRPDLVEQGFLNIQEKLDLTQHQLIKNEDDVFNAMWLEGHAGIGSLLLDLTLVTTSFPTMAELLIATKALWMALQQALPQEQYFPGGVGLTILLNDQLAMVKDSELGSAKLQRVDPGIVPSVTCATADSDTIKLVGQQLLSWTAFSATLPGNFTSYPLRVLANDRSIPYPLEWGGPGDGVPMAQTLTLTFPECLRSVTAAEIQLEACNDTYKSVQTRLSRESAAASSHPLDLHARQPQSQPVASGGVLDSQQHLVRGLHARKQLAGNERSKWSSIGSPAVQGHAQGTDAGASQSDAVICASCQQQVAQGCAKHQLPALGQYGWFCQKCQGRATLRGAILRILGRKGRKGATFADLKEALEKYRRSTARKSTSGEYGLLGDAIPERSQLAWMVDGQDGNNIGLPALVKKLPHENRLRILYTLAFPEEATRAPTHLHLLGPRDEPMGADLSAEAMSHDDAESSGESSNGSLRRNSVDGHAIATGPSEKVHSDKLDQEHWLATLDRLKCSECKDTGGHKDFLLCDSCTQGYHARCLRLEVPSTRFWWCPDCSRRGLTIKGLILQVLEKSDDKGLTTAEITEKVLACRPRGTYPHSVRGECSRLVNGVSGKMVNGHPVLERLGEGRYRLAPDPDFAEPDRLSSHAAVTAGHTEEPSPPPASIAPAAANAPAIQAATQSLLAFKTSRSVATKAAAPLAQPYRDGAQLATAAGSAALSQSLPAGAASSATARVSPAAMHLQHSAAAQTSPAQSYKGHETVKSSKVGLAEVRASLPNQTRAVSSSAITPSRYIDVSMPSAGAAQQPKSSGPKKAVSGDKRPRSAMEPQQPAGLKARLLSGPKSAAKRLVKSFDPARELLERTTVPSAELACDDNQCDMQSLADLVPEQFRAHQEASDQAGPTAGANPLGWSQQAGSQFNSGGSSAAKQSRNRFLYSDSDEELVDQKELLPEPSPKHAGREIVAPFSLRLSHQESGDREQVVTVWKMGQVHQGSNLQHFGKVVNGTYHYRYPVGYKAAMQVHNRSTRCLDWTLEVQAVDDAPRFQVQNEMGYEYVASVEATEDNRMMGLRGACDFGFQNDTVAQAIEQMYAAKGQRASSGQGLVGAGSAGTAPVPSHNPSISHHTALTKQHSPGTMSKGNVAEPKQQTDLQKDGELMDHASEEGDESTASDIGMEAEQKQTAPEPASAQKAIFSPVDDTVIVADSLPNEDAAAPPSQKADHDDLVPCGVSTLLQRLHVMDAANAPLDQIEEGIVQLLSCFPETEELEGYFSGWMMNMSMTDDSARQLRIRGVFADIQFLASHIPDAQAGSLQMMLQALLEGLKI